MHRKKCSTTLMIKGVGLVAVVSVTGLARILGKSRLTVLRYEAKDVFPEAPIKVNGNRFYPLTLANRLVPLVRAFPLNAPPSAEMVAKVNQVFNEEIEKLCPRK